MTRREARCLFTRLKAEFITWCFQQPGWEVASSEGYVADTDAADGDYDGPHMEGGGHYMGTCEDINLYVNKVWITNSDHPAFKKFGQKWLSMHKLARWGGNFKRKDANHISILFGGVA